ncbi:MAG: sugar transferase [Acidobacteriota bacterium]|nr:sugar transferase [Acidobacteriota bacterium]
MADDSSNQRAALETIPEGLTTGQRFVKRSFDLLGASLGLLLAGWLIAVGYLLAAFASRANGFFVQARVGRGGRLFPLLKLRTMRDVPGFTTSVTTARDPRITPMGRWLRRTKMDELPQLINVLLGQMSFVGPRPDVPGFADRLEGEDRVVLSLRPGITGPATLAFRREEELLAAQDDPERFNREVIWPEKVRLNRAYVEQWSLRGDVVYLWETLVGD